MPGLIKLLGDGPNAGLCIERCFPALRAGREAGGKVRRMTATLPDVAAKKKEPAEQQVAAELVRHAQEKGLSLTGPDGLLKQLTKTVIEAALQEEMTEHPRIRETRPGGCWDGQHPQRQPW